MPETLRLAAPTGIAETILIRAVGDLMKRYPDLEVRIRDGITPAVADYLLEKEVDLTLTGEDIELKNVGKIVTGEILHEEENVLIVPIGDLFALKKTLTEMDLADIVCDRILIGRPKGSAVHEKCRELLKKLRRDDRINDKQFIVESLEGSVRAVAAGIGVVIIPRGTAEEICPRAVKWISLPENFDDPRKFFVGWRSSHDLTDIQRELCRILLVKEKKS